ncbi:MAG: winged helix-turn-helix domain-containing protein [Myxococcota bacterium]
MIYRFGGCELDDSAGELRRDGQPVALQPKPLALLRLLIEERHRIVPNDELLERLWPGETVTPNSLSRAVSVARGAIGDAGRSGWIRSYTRRGYRFHGDVVALDDAAGSAGRGGAAGDPSADTAADGALPFVGREEPLSRLRAACRARCADTKASRWSSGRPESARRG